MKIGDKVRFLSEVGGGIVAGFQGKQIVLVEDEDGFQVPMQINEVVVVGDEDYSTKNMVETKSGDKKSQLQVEEEKEPADLPITFKAPAVERKDGDILCAYLAFVPMNSKELSNTRFEAYMVNDCNYYIRYAYYSAEGSGWHLRSTGEIEPNMMVFIEEFGHDQLNSMERVCVQLFAYKRDKPFMIKPTIDVQLRIDTVKFYKLHTFKENDFFEQPALIYTVVENDKPSRPLVVDTDKLKQEMMSKVKSDISVTVSGDTRHKANTAKDNTLVVDLHASEILDTTSGMSSSDILNYQLDLFRKTLNDNAKHKGMKVVFIHGKGEGVLRAAIINELRYRYKKYTYQDASFQEYGYGATMVNIK